MECLDHPGSDLPGLYWLAVDLDCQHILHHKTTLVYMLTPSVNGAYQKGI
jgi:hypothetical protein